MMNDLSLMPFGPHKGKRLGDVPGKYLISIAKTAKGPLKEYIDNNAPLLGKKNRY